MDDAEPGREKTSKYIVQRGVFVENGAVEPAHSEAEIELWKDIGTVDVPMRTHRKSAVAAALEQFAIDEGSHPSFFRALDEETGEAIPVTFEQPPAPPAPPARVKVGR